MSRKRKAAASPPSADPPPPVIIDPNGVYRPDWLWRVLGMARTTFSTEVRRRRLRVARRAGRYYLLGSWVLEWIAAGEVVRQPKAGTGGGDSRQAG
jgi:hypothetical protein